MLPDFTVTAKHKNPRSIRIAVLSIFIFNLLFIPSADTLPPECYSSQADAALAQWDMTENFGVKSSFLAEMYRKSGLVQKAGVLLGSLVFRSGRQACVIPFSGKYLVSEDIFVEDQQLVRACLYLDCRTILRKYYKELTSRLEGPIKNDKELMAASSEIKGILPFRMSPGSAFDILMTGLGLEAALSGHIVSFSDLSDIEKRFLSRFKAFLVREKVTVPKVFLDPSARGFLVKKAIKAHYAIDDRRRELLSAIEWKRPYRPTSEGLAVHTTRYCNMRCAHCFYGAPFCGDASHKDDPRLELDDSEVEAVIRFINRAKYPTVTIKGGGEPFLDDENIDKMCRIISGTDTREVSLISNGLWAVDKTRMTERIERLRKAFSGRAGEEKPAAPGSPVDRKLDIAFSIDEYHARLGAVGITNYLERYINSKGRVLTDGKYRETIWFEFTRGDTGMPSSARILFEMKSTLESRIPGFKMGAGKLISELSSPGSRGESSYSGEIPLILPDGTTMKIRYEIGELTAPGQRSGAQVPALKDGDRQVYKDDPERFSFPPRLLVDSDGAVGGGYRLELNGAFVLGSLEEGADVILERYSKDPIFRALKERRGVYLLDMISRRFDIEKDNKDDLREFFSLFLADEDRRLRVMFDVLHDYLWWDLTEQSRERILALEREFFGPKNEVAGKDQKDNKPPRNDEETADDELSGDLNGMTPFVKDGGTGIPAWDDSFRRLDSEREGKVLQHRAIRFCIPAEMIKNSVDFFAVMKKMAILNGARHLGARSFSVVITDVKGSDVPILQSLMTDRFRKLIGMRRNFKITLMTSSEIGEAAEALGVDIADPKARVELIRQMVTGRDAPKKGEKIAIFVDGVPKGESADAKRAISAGMDLGSSPESLLVFLFPSLGEGTVCYSFAEIMNRCMKAFNEFGNDGRLLVDIIPPTGIFTEQMRQMVEETRAMLKMLASA